MKKLSLLILISFLFISCSSKQNVWDDDVIYNQAARNQTKTRSTRALPEFFGIRFGQKLSTLNVIKKTGPNNYAVNPPKPEGYELYIVRINSANQEVKMISAGSSFNDKINCQSHQVRDIESIVEKFGKSSLVRNKDNSVTFYLYNTLITLSCSEKGIYTVIYSAMDF